MSLLENVKKVKGFLKNENSGITDLVEFISDIIGSNIYLLNAAGDILGAVLPNGADCTKMGAETPSLKLEFKQRIGFIFQTTANLPLESCMFHNEGCVKRDVYLTIIQIPTKNSGHILLTKHGQQFSDEELILAETAAFMCGVFLAEIGSTQKEESGTTASGGNLQLVLDSLSFSELKAIVNVFKDLNGLEGFLVASKIADRIGISRSVIVNAMRKLESAGVVDSRSLGIKGTYIKIKNPSFLEALKIRVNS